MRRADRLFQIIQLLRVRRLTTAADIAQELEISTRTVYRDVQDLLESGVPIEGEAGVGYRLRKGYELPAMTFTVDELAALVLGGRMVEAWADPDLGIAVRSAMKKIEGVLPEPLQESMLRTALFGPPGRMTGRAPEPLSRLRRAISDEHWVFLRYTDGDGQQTERTVVPLGLYFWGKQWLLAGYCLLRSDYRSFRVDRVHDLADAVPDASRLAGIDPPVSLASYIRAMERESCAVPRPAPPQPT
jgi:predicted DNA-binding transcriptional regulator YafY